MVASTLSDNVLQKRNPMHLCTPNIGTKNKPTEK